MANQQWIETSQVFPMFPTLVWKIQLKVEASNAIRARIDPALQRMRRDLPELASGHGWQSGHRLHELDECQDLVRYIHSTVKSVLRFLRIDCGAVEITGCWANILAVGAAHKSHSHPNNFLSGVYYLHTSPGAQSISFHDPRPQTAIIRPPVTALTAENTDQVVVSVSDGALLVFPAYLQHSVDANMGEGERVSISFNVMFSRFTENLSKPLW